MARLRALNDSDLVNDQIQREIETYTSSNALPERRRSKRTRDEKRPDIDGERLMNKTKKLRQRISDSKDEEPNYRARSSSKKYGDLGPDRGEKFDGDTNAKTHESSLSKKKKKKIGNGIKHDLYEVPGIQNLPPKRNRSSSINHSRVTEAGHDASTSTAVNAKHLRVTSYPGSSPFMSPPQALATENGNGNSMIKPPQAESEYQARLQSILKACSRNKAKHIALEERIVQEHESDGSPSPGAAAPPFPIKMEYEPSTFSCKEILKDYFGTDGRYQCPVDGCEKSYTRKDSLSGHIRAFHSGQVLRDDGDRTYSVVTKTSKQVTASDVSNLTSTVQKDHAQRSHIKPVMALAAPQLADRELDLYDKRATSTQRAAEGIDSENDASQSKVAKGSKTTKKKYEKTGAAELKLTGPNISTPQPTEHSSLDKLLDTDHEPDHDSSASEIVVRPSYFPRAPRPINPVVANIGPTEVQCGSALEDWEVSPGTVTTERDDIHSRNNYEVAYSASHIRSNPRVTEFANTSFGIHTLPSSCRIAFPLETFVRVCYVVSGKVQVRVDGATFAIGRGGMWRIIGLGHCIIDNRGYGDAIIHITSIIVDRGGCV